MYKIGNVVIRVEQVNGDHFFDRLQKFSCDNKQIDIEYKIFYLDELPGINKDMCVYFSDQLVVEKKEHGYRFFHVWNNDVYAVVDEDINQYRVYLNKDCLNNSLNAKFIPSLFHLEKPLLNVNSLVLHSASIEANQKAILFTAPSGGGKSTQADLWKEHKNSIILNGDKNIVGKENNKWNVYGIPFSGSSEYCENKTIEIGAIVILGKSPVNQITRLDLSGFQKVFSQITVNPWDKSYSEKAMDLTMELCCCVPIYYYSCTKDESAVEFLWEQLEKDGVF